MDILLGCGHSTARLFGTTRKSWDDLVRVDINPDVKPDVEWDCNNIPLPFSDNSADEIHAYNVLEHLGKQGDYNFFFEQFNDFWRILRPGGLLCATVPVYNSIWALGDPGHTRIINLGTLSFLNQSAYDDCDKSMRTDYRNIYNGDFKVEFIKADKTQTLYFVLKALKGDIVE